MLPKVFWMQTALFNFSAGVKTQIRSTETCQVLKVGSKWIVRFIVLLIYYCLLILWYFLIKITIFTSLDCILSSHVYQNKNQVFCHLTYKHYIQLLLWYWKEMYLIITTWCKCTAALLKMLCSYSPNSKDLCCWSKTHWLYPRWVWLQFLDTAGLDLCNVEPH